jgi:hypothetical protein
LVGFKQEELYLQEAIRNSLNPNVDEKNESKGSVTKVPASAPVSDLLDFGAPADPVIPPPTSNMYGPPTTSNAPWSGSYANNPNPQHAIPAAPPQTNPTQTISYSSQQATNPTSSMNSYGQSYDGGFGSSPSSNAFGGGVSSSSNPFVAPTVANTREESQGAIVPVAPTGVYSSMSSGLYDANASSNPYTQTNASNSNPYASQPNPYGPPVAVSSVGAPSTASSNPYSAPVASTPDQYSVPTAVSSNPYGASVSSNPYGASLSSNPYGASNASNPHASSSYGGAAAPADNQFSAPIPGGFVAPAPIATNLFGSQNMYGDAPIPPAVTPMQQQTPSTLGFGSPPADFNFSSPEPKQFPETNLQNGFETDPARGNQGMSMNFLSTQNEESQNNAKLGGLDQAFSKLVNLDSFSVASKKDDKRINPFENSANNTVGGSRSLADIQKSKVRLLLYETSIFYSIV